MYDIVHKHYFITSIILILCIFLLERLMGSWATIGILIFVIIIAHRKSYTREHENDDDA